MAKIDQTQETILIVDDTPANLRFLAEMLSSVGYVVRPSPDGEMGLRSAQIDPPDLILLDIMMPKLDGYAVCERLKEDARTTDIPVIFLSALTQTSDKMKAFAVGGVDYITKPFQIPEVLARVQTHLKLRSLQRRLEDTNRQLEERNIELEERNGQLESALHTIKTLSGLIPICGWCGRKIQDTEGEWVKVEEYIEANSEAQFTHGICPECLRKLR